MRCAFVSIDDFHSNRLFDRLVAAQVLRREVEWVRVTEKVQVNMLATQLGRVDKAFFIRWPHIVPPSVHLNNECIVFHTSNLPEGRGGSPLQNQIMEGVVLSHVNAIVMSDPVDCGDVYLSSPITLQGSVSDIWLAITDTVFDMICRILADDIKPVPQGAPSLPSYRRRTNNELTSVTRADSLDVFRFIQMLDGPGYPNAFIDVGDFRLTLSRASFREDGSILCDAVIKRRP